jgi:hypothetical protein
MQYKTLKENVNTLGNKKTLNENVNPKPLKKP